VRYTALRLPLAALVVRHCSRQIGQVLHTVDVKLIIVTLGRRARLDLLTEERTGGVNVIGHGEGPFV